MGRYVLAEDYVRAQRGRAVLTQAVDDALGDHDALVLPSLAIPAPRLGTDTVEIDGRPVSVRNVTLRLTQLFNATGHPAVSIPCGATASGLPVGLQLVGRRSHTAQLLDVTQAVEQSLA
jgi:aspartyl-tRNA(Asn)/glutamyl-tRNA(Gln) amidotransferase subunit A